MALPAVMVGMLTGWVLEPRCEDTAEPALSGDWLRSCAERVLVFPFAAIRLCLLASSVADAYDSPEERLTMRDGSSDGRLIALRLLDRELSARSSSISNIDVIPPDDLIGFGDFMARSLVGLMITGAGLAPPSAVVLDFRSKRSTSDVVGGMGVESVGPSVIPSSVCDSCVDNRRGLGPTAGL